MMTKNVRLAAFRIVLGVLESLGLPEEERRKLAWKIVIELETGKETHGKTM